MYTQLVNFLCNIKKNAHYVRAGILTHFQTGHRIQVLCRKQRREGTEGKRRSALIECIQNQVTKLSSFQKLKVS